MIARRHMTLHRFARLHNPPRRQRGAAMLIAAVFLVVIMVILGDISLRMSSTSVTDSSLLAEGDEALYLAESGLENASQQLANGTACTSLTMASPISFGNGDFQITAATLLGSDCQIQVTGRTLLGGTTLRATRNVEGLIQLSGGVGAIAVGANGTVLQWDGSSWTSVSTGITADFTGIDCPNSSSCMAVANNGQSAQWSGGSWTTYPAPYTVAFTDVACLGSTGNCQGIGTYFWFGLLQQWSGSTWNYLGYRWFDAYLAISCATSACYAVTSNGAIDQWNGASWGTDGNEGNQLNDISCTSDSTCWAVGTAINSGPNRGYAIYKRTGGGWSPDIQYANPRRDLYAIDCVSTSNCWAVGARRSGNAYTILHQNGGAWSEVNPSPGSAQDLNGISCYTDGTCWAVGNNGRTLYYNSSNWSVVSSPTTANLNDVYYLGAGGGGGGVSLLRWWEIIN